ncbi:hypothetical protein [Nannocystis sp.]|uniref:hypothetical protein n=1 Tax=Nannocystis sp. TaxID=1962667 RepID=UPI0025F5DC61|nr:hypothetical protein [Nannocystis sp.]MBK7828430.1 hypothetical protein [Nannocystis sp.]
MFSLRRSYRGSLVVVLAALSAACLVKREAARSLSVGEPARAASTEPRVQVEVLVDGRGEDASQTIGTSFVPLVNLFHLGATSLVPEQDRAIRSSANGFATQIVGSLDRDLGALLARRVPGGVFVEDLPANAPTADYVLTGTLERTAMRSQLNIFPGAVLSWLGVPFLYTDFELRFSLQLHRCGDRKTASFGKVYEYSGKRVSGAYYNSAAARALLVEGLRQTLDLASADVSAAIAALGPCAAPEAAGTVAPPG